jgi:tRNA(Ile)-lysidine synthase
LQQLQNLPDISKKSLRELKKGKNLLAFSGGVDSSALFFILVSYKIEFDIAMVDYQVREQSKKEIKYAEELAKKYKKKFYHKKADLPKNNFEHNARVFRYDFFNEIMKKEYYTHLVTAHQLNDKLEWFLMQFTKGAGLVELLGFDEIRKRDGYTLVRPLVNTSRDDILNFLKSNGIKYFIDETNSDTKYKRNYFRKNFSNSLLKEYKNGIIKSFRYLQTDKNQLFDIKIHKKINNLYIIKETQNSIYDIRAIDYVLKELGYLLSKKQKDEIIAKKDVVISDRFAIVFKESFIYISPYIKITMDKKFKEKCRIRKIPSKIRGYIYKNQLDLDLLSL